MGVMFSQIPDFVLFLIAMFMIGITSMIPLISLDKFLDGRAGKKTENHSYT